MTEYRREEFVSKTEQFLGAKGVVVSTKQKALFVSVKNQQGDSVFFEYFGRVAKGTLYNRDGLGTIESATINPTFVKMTEKEANDYKSYLYGGKEGLYFLVLKSMKQRGVL